MKYIFLALALFTTTCLTAQTIYFKDGTKKSGIVKYGPDLISANMKITDKVIYKASKKDKNKIGYDYTEISKIERQIGNEIIVDYLKIPADNTGIILPVNLVFEGKVKLYRHTTIGDSPMPNGGVNTYVEHVYYVQKNEDYIHRVFPNKFMGPSSERLLKEYFNDCPKLVELIDREAFKMFVANSPELRKNSHQNRLLEIVKFYESKCSKPE